MKRLVHLLAATALLAALAPAAASAEFGLSNLDVTFTDSHGEPAMQAGSHPFQMTTSFDVNTVDEGGGTYVDGPLRNADFFQAAGFAGSPTPGPRCSTADFLSRVKIGGVPYTDCPDSSAVGTVVNVLGAGGKPEELIPVAVYNLEAPPGVAARLGFWVANVPVTVEIGVNPDPPYNVIATLTNTAQTVEVFASELTLWGNPADPGHDSLRGHCLGQAGESCSVNIPVKPFFTLPRRCDGPLKTTYQALSWWSGGRLAPGPPEADAGFGETHDAFGPLGTTGCGKLSFSPRISTQPSSDHAESPSGLDVNLDIDDEGLTSPAGIAHSDIKKAVVTLPEGVTANPSQAEGLAVCSEADLARETATSSPGAGCPQASKIGTVEVETPLLEGEILKGSLFIAEPYKNRFGSLLALYTTIKSPKLGVGISLAGKVEPDPATGQLVTTFDNLPQLPFSHFRLRFREGGRSPLITPPSCGSYETKAVFTPYANSVPPFPTTSTFQVTKGVGGAPCPPPGTPPFDPGFEAGTLNNNAGSHSPFLMRLTRRDGDQDLTRFSSVLPPGLVPKLAGLAKCTAAAIAAAKARSGKAELASPSCPASSRIGSVLAGAGVGSQLTYVPGSVYLAGPYRGDPLSAVAIVPAVAGPFDVGTVVTQVALTLNPVTYRGEIDGAKSDPIPHILKGIPLKVRDIRIDVDRPDFILNPTSCDPSRAEAEIWGGGANPFSLADDAPVPRGTRFQAANCSSLPFKPKLSINLKGATKRGGFPALRAELRGRPGDANLAKAVVTLPHSAFLAQEHIRTICTRVQFAADNCPKGSIYGKARAFTPLLDEPLEGPVYLRSSSNPLPDMVIALEGIVDIDVVGRIDSVNASIRSTFASVPDAPIGKVVLTMQGGKKGLVVNSRNLCATKSRGKANFTGQNAKGYGFKPVVRASGCGEKGRQAARSAPPRRD